MLVADHRTAWHGFAKRFSYDHVSLLTTLAHDQTAALSMFNSGDDPIDLVNLPWSQIPSAFLEHELRRRQDGEKPKCGSHGHIKHYNVPLHWFALFLILFLSTVACSFPVIARNYPRLPIPHRFLFLSRHFGTGVLIATAFVHLLPTGFQSLTDPCLPDLWNKGYPPMAGAVAMFGVIVVVGVEMFFAVRGASHVHGSDFDHLPLDDEGPLLSAIGNGNIASKLERRKMSVHAHRRSASIGGPLSANRIRNGSNNYDEEGHHFENGHTAGHHQDSEDSDMDLDELDPGTEPDTHALPSASLTGRATGRQHAPRQQAPTIEIKYPNDPAVEKLLRQCLLLEASIIFHSVFIGLTLSLTSKGFTPFLVAISIHQAFEGLALGARIAAIPFPRGSLKPWFMSLAYGVTTPFGQLLGLLLLGTYDPMSESGLILTGLSNAFGAGLLLFAGLTELLAEDFLSERSLEELKGSQRLQASAMVIFGAVIMAITGAFA